MTGTMIASVRKSLQQYRERKAASKSDGSISTYGASANLPTNGPTSFVRKRSSGLSSQSQSTNSSAYAYDDSEAFTVDPFLPTHIEFSGDGSDEIGAQFDVMTPISYDAVSFEVVELVCDSWENKVKKIPNWKDLTGEMFMRKCFELDPSTKDMFGFPDVQHDDPSLSTNKEFIAKGVRLIMAVDTAIGFLGPDLGKFQY